MGDRRHIAITKENPLKFWEMWPLVNCHECHTEVFQNGGHNGMIGRGFAFNISQVSSDQLAAFQVRSDWLMYFKFTFLGAAKCYYSG